jgi:aspartyl/asparaginyl beta-hydroxylase (cupin superfamily)
MRWPWEAATEIAKGVVDIGKEYIVDKDKQIEFEYKINKAVSERLNLLLTTKTTPVVDGIVKLMFAFKELARPILGGAMTVFAAYCVVKNIQIDKELLALFAGGFPLWGVSRYLEKKDRKD